MMRFNKILYRNSVIKLVLLVLIIFQFGCKQEARMIEGWNILSDNEEDALEIIRAAKNYGINHLQLSHHVIQYLNELEDTVKRKRCNMLVDSAHKAGIEEVVVWDHSLYDLDYYPDKFKIDHEGKINLDNPEFWIWLKQDYRRLLDLAPNIDGIVLTFIETGAFVEDQYSEKLVHEEDKLAALIDTLADVIINERGMNLYIRTFIYTQAELEPILKCLSLINNEDIIVMVKETPQDFFLTFRNQNYIEQISQHVLMEFDGGNEYNGQNVIANTFVDEKAARWKYYSGFDNVIGYVARTSRFGTTSIVNQPSEILLYTLHRLSERADISTDQIYDEFIRLKYGAESILYLKPAFKNSFDIITSILYTLGLNTAKHSKLDFDYISNYTRFVPGRWLDNPVFHVAHGVDKDFHYYKDIVEHLSPAKYKMPDSRLFEEDPFLIEKNWVTDQELMDSTYLAYIITEKDFGVKLAHEALREVELTEELMDRVEYDKIYGIFYRTWLTAKLYRACGKMYYGHRISMRGDLFRTFGLERIIKDGVKEMQETIELINAYNGYYPVGGWDWKDDKERALEFYFQPIIESGWPKINGW